MSDECLMQIRGEWYWRPAQFPPEPVAQPLPRQQALFIEFGIYMHM